MNLFVNLSRRLSLIYQAAYFLKKHLMVILGLGFIAGFGRVIQLGGFGQIASWFNILLEVIVEFARLLLFLYVLGFANFRKGASRIRQFFVEKNSRKLYLKAAIQKFRKQWIEILLNFAVFSVIAWAINYMIEVLAYQTCLYLTLRQHEILDPGSSEWTIILFFKNILVIPFTLTFEALFLLWIINRFRNYKMVRV